MKNVGILKRTFIVEQPHVKGTSTQVTPSV